MRVLVVDDDRDGANMLRLLIERLGHEARVALDGLSALQAANDFKPDLVLLDIVMPGMDGYALAQKLRSEVGLNSARIVALSGLSPDSHRVTASGIDQYVLKPLLSSGLRDLLSSEAS